MFNPDLTTESALARIGTFNRSAEWILDADNDLIRRIKETGDQAALALIQTGDLKVAHASMGFNDFKTVTGIGDAFRGRHVDTSNAFFSELVLRFDLLENFPAALPFFLEELVHNALEHGTAYCSQGAVRVWCIIGNQGGVLGVDQSPSAVMASALQERMRSGLLTYTRPSGRKGGIGLTEAVEIKKIEVNFEDISTGLRTLIFSALI